MKRTRQFLVTLAGGIGIAAALIGAPLAGPMRMAAVDPATPCCRVAKPWEAVLPPAVSPPTARARATPR